MKAKNTTEHLCDSCNKYILFFPNCMPEDVSFGNGKGNDNIIECSEWEPQ